ncbi:hypothetical protein Ddye_028318 [Dipteronia dyeriana]|uniref:Uncharacterized protein n=1 Tax=Dipteronia dyeriana TaxID=168575 RepID=A0AAD9TRN9_9ROSI|nr:hypothetical protein Ddye_028318 [Dipteronia dyeriana]
MIVVYDVMCTSVNNAIVGFKHFYSGLLFQIQASREEAKSIRSQSARKVAVRASEDIPDHIKSLAASYREVEARKNRVQELEKLYMDMAMQRELQKKGRKRKL